MGEAFVFRGLGSSCVEHAVQRKMYGLLDSMRNC